MKALTLFLALTSMLCADVRFPNYDMKSDSMLAHRIEFYPYQASPIPRLIHQIWFGDAKRCPKQTREWKQYSIEFEYEYLFWNEYTLTSIATQISKTNLELIHFFLGQKNYWSASDILRCELMKIYGGIYVDCDFHPPKRDGAFIDIQSIAPLEDAIFLTENHAPNIHTGAFFVCNGFMAAAKNHPIMQGMCSQFKPNIDHWYHRQCNYDASYTTGPFLLNKVINGSFRIIPIQLSADLKMWD